MSTCRPQLFLTTINHHSPGSIIYVKPGDEIHIDLSIKSNANCKGFYEIKYSTNNEIGIIKEKIVTLYSDSLYVEDIYYTVEEDMRIYIDCGYIKNNTKIITDGKGPWIIRIKEPTSTEEYPTYHKKQKCTLEDFRRSYIKHEGHNPVFDVTDTVKQVYPDTIKATLYVYTDDINKIDVSIVSYSHEPRPFSAREKVEHWLNGREYVRMYCSKNGRWYYIVFPCKLVIEKEKKCTKEDFIRSYLNFYHNNTTHDVTNIVKQVYRDTKRAILKVDANRIIKIIGPYDSLPPKLSPERIVNNWKNGEEWVRMFCSKNNKYYWVVFRCKLEIERQPQPTTPSQPSLIPLIQPTHPSQPTTPPTQPTEPHILPTKPIEQPTTPSQPSPIPSILPTYPSQPTTPETPITKPKTSQEIPIEVIIPAGMIGAYLLLRKR